MTSDTTTPDSPLRAGEPEGSIALDRARATIDRVDAALVELLSERLRAVEQVASAKRGRSSEVVDPERERSVLAAWRERARVHGVPRQLAESVLDRIVESSRRLQEPRAADPDEVKVAFQGEEHCYSDLAAAKLFGLRGDAPYRGVPARTFFGALDLLRAGEVDYALLPVENSLVGAIGDVNAALARGDLYVVDEETLEIEHVLAAIPGATLEGIAEVRSHPVALRQCQSLFREHPAWRAREHVDTAGAAHELARERDASVAVISSAVAAEACGLVVLRRSIADADANITRFVLLAREPEIPPDGARAKTSLLATLDHARGSLADLLSSLARSGVNLTRIESRPQPDRPWEYLFLVDVEGRADVEPLAGALGRARQHCNSLRVIGSYPTRMLAPCSRSVAPSVPRPIRVASEPRPEPASAPEAERRIDLAGVPVGGTEFALIAGPCAVESEEQIHAAAAAVAARGVRLMRGGAFKPRTSPRSFQGHGERGLLWLAEAAHAHGMGVVTEVLSTDDVDLIARHADVLQVGARNMQNFELLKALGRIDRPVLLKRGMSATLDELLGAVDYITAGGNQRVVLCERGIRTFETATRFSLDPGAMAALMERTSLPVIADPSHAAGRRSLVLPLARSAVAAGAHGLIVEVHPRREEALCDKDQALAPDDLDRLIEGVRPILAAQGREL